MRFTEITLSLSALTFVVQGNDIIFYNSKTDCNGTYLGCFNYRPNRCCFSSDSVSYVSISKTSGYDIATVFSGGGCTTQTCRAGSKGTVCCGPGSFTGGRWFQTARRKRGVVYDHVYDDNYSNDDDGDGDGDEEDPQQSPIGNNNCTAEVNVFGYALDAHSGWEIRAEDVKEDASFASLHEEFKTLASHEKMGWLRARGAVYRPPPDHGQTPL